jgi:hypothetical protein
MSEKEKEERAFHYDLTKAQVDSEFLLAVAIAILAIGYGLFSYYKDNFLGIVATDGLLLIAVLFLVRVYNVKEARFRKIKNDYIEKSPSYGQSSENETRKATE